MSQTKGTTRRTFVAGGIAAAGSLASWPLFQGTARAQAKAEHTMIFAHTFTAASEQYIVTGIELFKQLAEKYSGGKLHVDVHDGGKLGGQNVLPQKVQQGAIQATQLSMQNFTPFAEVYNVLDFPYLFATNDAFERFLDHPYFLQSALGTEPTAKNLRILPGMWANCGYRAFCLSRKVTRDIRQPEDLKGLKVRVTSSRIEQQAFALTPASPVSINWAETYQAMQQGAADGLNVAIAPLQAYKINEVLGAAIKIDMTMNAHLSVVNRPWYDKLPAPVRDAIDRAARESWAHQRTEQRKANATIEADWKAKGIKVVELTPAEKAKWVQAVGHQRAEWAPLKDRYGKALYERVAEIGGKA